jgi:predicted dehydrogenase
VLNCAPPGYPAYHQLDLYGTGGAIRARDHELTSLTRFTEAGADYPGRYEMLLHNLPAYARELAELVDAIRDDRPVSLPPSEARAALHLALAAVRSAHLGTTVVLADMEAVA